MELITCKKCKVLISDKNKVCPECGYPVLNKKQVIYLLNILTIIIVSAWGSIYWYNLSQAQKSELLQVFKFNSSQPAVVYDKEVKVPKDQFIYVPVTLQKNAYVSVEYLMKSGPEIDAIFMDARDFKVWQQIMDNNYNAKLGYIDYLSSFGTTKSKKTLHLPHGDYYAVINNTSYSPVPRLKIQKALATLKLKITVNYN